MKPIRILLLILSGISMKGFKGRKLTSEKEIKLRKKILDREETYLNSGREYLRRSWSNYTNRLRGLFELGRSK